MADANRSKYKQEFQAADKDKSGHISKKELLGVLEALEKPTEGLDRIFARVDKNGSGEIDLNEFYQFMEELDNAWVRVQNKTFTRWANTVLSNRMLTVQDISKDLQDGVLLKDLIELLAKQELPKITKAPKMRLQKMENLNKSLDFLKRDGVKLVNIGADDLTDGNQKITLGLIWLLILKYQIGEGVAEGSPKWALLEWVKNQIAPYKTGIKLKNFKNGWSDGKVLSALTDSLGEDFRGIIDPDSISADPYEASRHAMDTAKDKFDIPKIMDPDDIVEEPDEHSIMTYVSYFRDWAENQKSKADPRSTIAYGPGVEGGEAGAPTHFTVECRNKQGKPVTTGNHAVGASVKGPDGKVVPVNLVDNNNGTYSGSYPVSLPGDYTVDVRMRNEPIVGSEFTAHMESGSPTFCYAEGKGLESGNVGQPAVFTIFSVDKHGNRVKKGGDPFTVALIGPKGEEPVQFKDLGDGTYPCQYFPKETGKYQISIKLFNKDIDGSPYNANIEMWSSPQQTVAYGPGVEGAKPGEDTVFTVETRNPEGKRLPMGGDAVTANVRGPDGKETPVKLIDNKDGTYTGKYPVKEPGTYDVDVRLRNEPIKGSVFHPRHEAGNPAQCYAEGEGLAKGKTGRPAEFTIHSVDKAGKPVVAGGDPFKVVIKGPKGAVPVEVKDKGDGTYPCSYVPKDEGPHQISITLFDEAIKDSPWTSAIKRAPNAAKSWVDGPGLKLAVDGKPTFITVHALDDQGKPVAGDNLAVAIEPQKGQKNKAIPTKITDNGDGTYTVAYTPDTPGRFLTTVQLDGQDVKDTPAPLSVLSPNSTFASGKGVQGGAAPGNPTDFLVEMKDLDGNRIPHTGAPLTVEVQAPNGKSVPAKIKDNGDGTYTGSYPVDAPGDYKVDVKLADAPINGSAFDAHAEAGNSAQCYAEGDGLKKGKTKRPAKFTIFSVDKEGKRVVRGGDPFVVKITGPDGPQKFDLQDKNDGTYNVQYIPTKEGEYKIDVTLFGKPILDAPFTAKIKRAPDASKSWVDGPGLKRAFDNKPTYFVLHALDEDGKPVAGDDVTSVIAANPGQKLADIPVKVTDNGDGTYHCEFEPTDAGKFNVICKLDGQDVKDTPKPLTVRVGGDPSKTNTANFLVTIVAMDKRGNAKTEGGDDWEVEILDAEGNEHPAQAKDNGDGTYSAKYSLKADPDSNGPTEYNVHLRLGGMPLACSPLVQRI